MNKICPERITYAQKKLIDLIDKRQLKQWCDNNGLSHSAMYRIAIGDRYPTYSIISSMVHLIAPIEWLFFTDEKLPYKPQLLPVWNPNDISLYVKMHQNDYKQIIFNHKNIEPLNAYNIFVNHRAKPSITVIRELCSETNPINFFIAAEQDIVVANIPNPVQGDIVNFKETAYFVLSKNNRTHFIGCEIVSNKSNKGIELINTKFKGNVVIENIQTIYFTSNNKPLLIEKTNKATTESLLKSFFKLF